MKLLALACLLGLAYGQKYPCCTKSKFEVFEFMQLFVAQRGQAVYKEILNYIAYDEDIQMVNAVSYDTTLLVVKIFRTLVDYKKKRVYTIEGTNCTKTKITAPFPPPCVPPGSEEVEHLNFGNETSATKTTVYQIQETLGQNGYVTVTTADCIPVLENLHGKIGEADDMQFKGYSNFTEGIKDPSVFDVPPECKHAKLTDLIPNLVVRHMRSIFYGRH